MSNFYKIKEDFRIKLSTFQEDVTNEWLKIKHQRIGVSIQLKEMMQDEKSCTRYKAVNRYCQYLLDEKEPLTGQYINRDSCDRLDHELKEELQRLSVMGIGCRCHKGISNLVKKFTDKVDNTAYYIFFGQFLLTNTENDKELRNYFGESINETKKKIELRNLQSYEFISDNKIHYTSYVQRNPFTDYDSVFIDAKCNKKNRNNVEIMIHDLSMVNIIDFISFKDFVEIEFEKFLNELHENDIPLVVKELNESPSEIINELLMMLRSCTQKQKTKITSKETDHDEKQGIHKTIDLLTEIDYIISRNGERIQPNYFESMLKHLQTGEINHRINTKEWFDKMKKLKEELN